MRLSLWPSGTTVVPVVNRPGTTEGNWQWRFTAEDLGSLRRDHAARLRHWIELYDRTGDRPVKDYSEPPEDQTTDH